MEIKKSVSALGVAFRLKSQEKGKPSPFIPTGKPGITVYSPGGKRWILALPVNLEQTSDVIYTVVWSLSMVRVWSGRRKKLVRMSAEEYRKLISKTSPEAGKPAKVAQKSDKAYKELDSKKKIDCMQNKCLIAIDPGCTESAYCYIDIWTIFIALEYISIPGGRNYWTPCIYPRK